ncbi:uncharacterized protein LOC18021597 [Eutrema salsugineum]|uniref:uncharacterized protein LOC18021597 n=1 Tax=Eutrema salsugineum TaxID=72664 RepID=UPI000CED07E0|nr:uncharacterized protein LOC18021597 [Eutrema salsugineum]
MRNLEREADEKRRSVREGKRVQESKPENTELVLKIFKGFTIDERDLTQPYEGPEYFRIMAWTDDQDQYGTQAIKSYYGLHFFNQKLVIPLDSPADQNLYIELQRGFSWKDPGTSNGTVVMGRARIELPPRNSHCEFTSKVKLVGLNSDQCVGFKGYLDISMKLNRYFRYHD